MHISTINKIHILRSMCFHLQYYIKYTKERSPQMFTSFTILQGESSHLCFNPQDVKYLRVSQIKKAKIMSSQMIPQCKQLSSIWIIHSLGPSGTMNLTLWNASTVPSMSCRKWLADTILLLTLYNFGGFDKFFPISEM